MTMEKFTRLDFIIKCSELRPAMKFQYWFNGGCSKTHYYYNQIKKDMFLKNDLFLRTSIENENISEIRLDLDRESLKENIELALDIYLILKQHNIKATYYTTGGKGIHIQFLIDVSKLNLSIDERLHFKKEYLEKLNILKLVDSMPLSPHTLLGCEGYKHRKTEKNKIPFDIEKYYNYDLIIDYITQNQNKIIIDFGFFDRINKINLTYSKNQFNTSTISPTKVNKPIQIKKTSVNRFEGNNQEIKLQIEVFSILYVKKDLESTYYFPLLVLSYLREQGLNKNQIENLFYNVQVRLNKTTLWDFEKLYKSLEGLTSKYNSYLMYVIKEKEYFTYRDLKQIDRRLKN